MSGTPHGAGLDHAPATRPLTEAERAYVERARDTACTLYAGVTTPHRSCGISLAETFARATPPYQSLRRGGITGRGTCGAVRAGEQILGELLGDPSPTGAVTERLRDAISWYQDQVPARIDRGTAADLICNHLTRPLGEFSGPTRMSFCTRLAAEVAALTAETLVRFAPEAAPMVMAPDATPVVTPTQETP